MASLRRDRVQIHPQDKDIIEAVNHIADCSGKFKLLEQALRDAKMAETCIVKEKQDYKQKLKALKIEVSKLKGKEATWSGWAPGAARPYCRGTSVCAQGTGLRFLYGMYSWVGQVHKAQGSCPGQCC